jgi:hypothetical protein
MATNDDILAAMAKERNSLLASSIDPFSACLTNAEIVANHKKLTKPGQGQQKLGSDARLGAPTSAVSGMEHLDAKTAFKIPGLNEAMAKEKARNSGEYSP